MRRVWAATPPPSANTIRYESLPPNFSLAANMVAGAFAGIAVWASSHSEETTMKLNH